MSSHDPGRHGAEPPAGRRPRRARFRRPILFQGKEIGQVHLGIYEAPLTRGREPDARPARDPDARHESPPSRGGTYLLAQRLAGPIRVLRNSLDELAHGRYDYRIGDTRKDEFGELYADFDRTAAALEKRHGHADAAAPSACTETPQ